MGTRSYRWKATNDILLVASSLLCRLASASGKEYKSQWPDDYDMLHKHKPPALASHGATLVKQPKAADVSPRLEGVVAEADDLLHWVVGSECSHIRPINDVLRAVSRRASLKDSALG